MKGSRKFTIPKKVRIVELRALWCFFCCDLQGGIGGRVIGDESTEVQDKGEFLQQLRFFKFLFGWLWSILTHYFIGFLNRHQKTGGSQHPGTSL